MGVPPERGGIGMTGKNTKLAAVGVAVALAGCTGLIQSTPSEPIAQLDSIAAEQLDAPVSDLCQVDYDISKQQGVMIQLKQGPASQWEGNGQYFSEAETQIDSSILVDGGGKPIAINAYETPENGTGRSLQLWEGHVTEECELQEISA